MNSYLNTGKDINVVSKQDVICFDIDGDITDEYATGERRTVGWYPVVYFEAAREIQPGEELLWDYGRNFTALHGTSDAAEQSSD